MQLLLLVKVCRIKIITTDRHTHTKRNGSVVIRLNRRCVCVLCVVKRGRRPDHCVVFQLRNLSTRCVMQCARVTLLNSRGPFVGKTTRNFGDGKTKTKRLGSVSYLLLNSFIIRIKKKR